MLIHFGKDGTQEWLLVRMKDKDAKPAAGEAVPAPAGLADGSATAKITVLVPADAEVFFDGAATTDTGSKRVFATPALEKARNTITASAPTGRRTANPSSKLAALR